MFLKMCKYSIFVDGNNNLIQGVSEVANYSGFQQNIY